MPQDTSKDIAFIREWMSKEPHLPQDFEDAVIAKFLHSCYYSLEQTKQCIDRFCTTRALMPEVYTNRDPLSPHMKVAFSTVAVSSCKWENMEILIHKFEDPTLDKYVFYDFVKTHTLQGDYWMYNGLLPEGHYIIFDMMHYSLRMVPKTNIIYLRDYFLFMLEGMPIRLKKIFVINTPSFYDTLYALIKPALPAAICELISFHPNHECLFKFIDKKYLPKEYGGEAQGFYEQNQEWVKGIEEKRKMFLNEKLWTADIKKKPKGSGFENTMNGSFRSLSID